MDAALPGPQVRVTGLSAPPPRARPYASVPAAVKRVGFHGGLDHRGRSGDGKYGRAPALTGELRRAPRLTWKGGDDMRRAAIWFAVTISCVVLFAPAPVPAM